MFVFQVCVDVIVWFNALGVNMLYALLERVTVREISFTYIFTYI